MNICAAVEEPNGKDTWTASVPESAASSVAIMKLREYVAPTAKPLTVWDQLAPDRFWAWVDARFAERINRPNYATTRQGPVLELVLDDGSVFPQQGQAVLVDREVDVRTGTMTIKGFFPNPRHILRPGQYAKVRAALDVKTGALLVPQKAVTELQGGFRVVVVGADGKADIRAVEPGERVGSLWIIDKGVKAGENVIVAGLQFVRPGMTVKPRPAPPEPDAASASPAP